MKPIKKAARNINPGLLLFLESQRRETGKRTDPIVHKTRAIKKTPNGEKAPIPTQEIVAKERARKTAKAG